ncbi:hypothetical protein HPG69_007717 [Diceros bicornis minor]|uniref:Uncharacterized protein n=1 Tax=Diceros bicornis minor TaxID=77932 RepID=A0A7J7EAJ7_DICBM|nr:hypothetical protein HPG69_007717 [Diceros bicornis minor]
MSFRLRNLHNKTWSVLYKRDPH